VHKASWQIDADLLFLQELANHYYYNSLNDASGVGDLGIYVR
jgi:hypothetical protein